MGVLSWLFPSAEDRVERGRKALASKQWRDARDEVEGIDGAAAAEVRRDANNGLAALNLAHALEWSASGDDERAQEHLGRAEELHQGGLEEAFRDTRRQMRGEREGRKEDAARRQSEAARAAQVDPLGLVGRGILGEAPQSGALALEDDEKEARIALVVENYPAGLRDSAAKLGPDFVDAVLTYEDGRPDLALQALFALPDGEPLVQLERSRCCWSLGDPQAAITALRRFASLAGGHHRVGPDHTAVMLGAWLAQAGDLDGSLAVLRDLRVTDSAVGGVLHAQVLLTQHRRGVARGSVVPGLLAEAEDVIRDVIARVGKNADLYELLAQVRLDGDHRVPAMHALELAIAACCDNPAKCGFKPPEPRVLRQLATLYLEDNVEVARAVELATQALAAVKTPEWDDLYLDALVGKFNANPDAADAADEVWARTPDDDPRRERLGRYLPLA